MKVGDPGRKMSGGRNVSLPRLNSGERECVLNSMSVFWEHLNLSPISDIHESCCRQSSSSAPLWLAHSLSEDHLKEDRLTFVCTNSVETYV